MEDIWEIMAANPVKREDPKEKPSYSFDSMGYALPRLDDEDAMKALRLVTSETPVIAKMRPLGKEYMCHQNAERLAKQFGGEAVRGYRVELSVNDILEVMDHSVIRAGDSFYDVTPYFDAKRSMFVGFDRLLPEFYETSFNPMFPQYGVRRVLGRPNFFIPLTPHGQRTLHKRVGSAGKVVKESELGRDDIWDRHNIIVERF